MMRYAFSCLLIAACTHAQNYKANNLAEVAGYQTTQKDTLITYDIEGISTEGARTEVRYVNGAIAESTTTIYGEIGKAIVAYKFEKDRIKVSETQYSYKTHVVDIKSGSDIRVSKQLSYYIDFDGNVIGKPVPERADIFQEFKQTVPFKLD